MDPTPTDPLLTIPEVAELLQVSTLTLAAWRSRGEGPRYVKLGAKMVRYRRADLDAWVAEGAATVNG
jgi:excisionase family DNA binding protein